jgi:mannose-6-phosphate isomerase-like protein (cupin superfamily)
MGGWSSPKNDRSAIRNKREDKFFGTLGTFQQTSRVEDFERLELFEPNKGGNTMVEMKNPIKEADANPKVNHLGLWRTDLAYFWVINCEANIQDDMHYHENDDHIFMVIEGECTVRTPHKEFVLKQFDTVLLKSGEPYQLCNTGKGRMLLLGAGNAGVDGKPRTRVPKIPSRIPVTEPVIA